MLGRFLRQLVASEPTPGVEAERPPSDELRVLNVGGASKAIPIPEHYAGWDHQLLDIDPRGEPDVLCDARALESLEPDQFDAVYCSHNLEHYYKHEGALVLRGFRHVLRPDGFAEIRVPDMRSVMRAFVDRNMDIEDTLYVSPSGPIAVRDVIYGWGLEIERSGDDFYAHKTGFTAASLQAAIGRAGFHVVLVGVNEAEYEIRALAFKANPNDAQRALLRLPEGGFD